MPIEDRIDQLARLALVIILIATLGAVSLPRAQVKKPPEGARKIDVSRLLARPCLGEFQDGPLTRPERRAKAI